MYYLNSKISSSMKKRIIFDIILLGTIFYAPWWIVAILAFAGVFYYPAYLEIFIFGMLFDILYGSGSYSLSGVYGILGATAIYIIASYARRAVR